MTFEDAETLKQRILELESAIRSSGKKFEVEASFSHFRSRCKLRLQKWMVSQSWRLVVHVEGLNPQLLVDVALDMKISASEAIPTIVSALKFERKQYLEALGNSIEKMKAANVMISQQIQELAND